MNHLRTFALVVLAGLIVLPAGPSFGQATKYLDEQGHSHWVQGPGWVPDRYRDKASQPALPKLRSDSVIGNERVRPEVEGQRTVTKSTEWTSTSFSEMGQRAQEQARTEVEWQAAMQRVPPRTGVPGYSVPNYPLPGYVPSGPPTRDPTLGLRYYESAEPVTTFSDGSKQIDSLTYKEALEAREREKIQKQCSKVRADGSNASIGTYNACATFFGR